MWKCWDRESKTNRQRKEEVPRILDNLSTQVSSSGRSLAAGVASSAQSLQSPISHHSLQQSGLMWQQL